MSRHHPSNELIHKFCNGELDAFLASLVSAHIDSCGQCAIFKRDSEKSLSQQQLTNSSPDLNLDSKAAWVKMLARLESSPSSLTEPSTPSEKVAPEILLEGQKFLLPPSIGHISSDKLKWMPFGQSGKITKIDETQRQSLFLIYLSFGEQVPFHSHKGTEYSYVVSGSFSSDGHDFVTGDFSFSDPSVSHSPRATSQDGCLIISSVENRLNFLHGILKPLNGLLWWFLNWRFKWMCK